MAQYIDKSALVAEIEKRKHRNILNEGAFEEDIDILFLINTLEVKEVGINIPNIDDLLEEEGVDPASKKAKVFKESYYMALEKLKEKKGKIV